MFGKYEMVFLSLFSMDSYDSDIIQIVIIMLVLDKYLVNSTVCDTFSSVHIS